MKIKVTCQKPCSILLFWVVGLAASKAATLVGDHFIQEDATASPAEEGNLTMGGKFLTVGFNTTLGGVTLQYQIVGGGTLADIAMIANDTKRAEWSWGYDNGSNGMALQMALGSNNVLSLFDTATPHTAGIILDPGDGSAGSASIKIDGVEVITTSNSTQNASLNLGSGEIRGNGNFGIALGSELPVVNDGSITISNSSRTIGNGYDYSKGFLNILSSDLAGQKLSIDPNQFVTDTQFHFQSEEHFVFRTPETVNHRELIAEFTTDATHRISSKKASVMIGNGTILDGQYSPSILGNNESSNLAHYPSLIVAGTGKSQQDISHAHDHAVISLTTRIHNGDPLNGSFAPFTNKDIFSIGNHGHVPALRIAANGFVGLGTKNPEAQLHITQNGKIDGSLSVGGNTLNVLQSGSVEIGKDSNDGSVPLQVGADGSVTLAKAQGDISMGDFGE